MTIELGSKVTVEIEGKSFEGVVTQVDAKEYVVIYEVDGKIEFKKIKL